MTAARPPPARPHIGIRASTTQFSSYSIVDWGEDDAWDSGSDEERSATAVSSGSSRNAKSPTSTAKTTPARVVPLPASNTSPVSLSSSYTHVNAPNPSSYPPVSAFPDEPTRGKERAGWTVIRKTKDPEEDRARTIAEDDLESEMIVGEMDTDSLHDRPAETPESDVAPSLKIKATPKIRPEVQKIMNDPLHIVHMFQVTSRSNSPAPSTSGSHPVSRSKSSDTQSNATLMRERSLRTNRRHKFVQCLSKSEVNIAELRKLSWSGIPATLRPVAWPLLLGYLPLPTDLRNATLARKRSEYDSLVHVAFAKGREGLDQAIWHQIEIDVPRTRPGIPLWMCNSTQRCLERILYVWAIRHPASGYVQGINDLVTPFFEVFLSAYIDSDPEQFDPELLSPDILCAIEADSFWCLSRLLDGIQDNYIFAQPGIHRSVGRMAELVARIDPALAHHLQAQGVEFMQFAFRWMNCLLMREISVSNTIRMWDTYLAEGPDAFSQFHLYVCSAFLVKWSDKLKEMDFQGIIMFLQSLPTQDWTDHDVELLLSEAFLLNSVWHHAQSHFGGK
ncbi:RabGAP/TBC [Sistotremastrum niveocremeum HHB9708]|uniref:RabGAP/TBC n=1 Tax=Sistotremastrum niveocremeum HHB9708 TaxID=1314777 RepID=A0A165A1K7_9AGAM|nr:RabGAP/TBC [Sistotremastrum niveocremeum HHB9708]